MDSPRRLAGARPASSRVTRGRTAVVSATAAFAAVVAVAAASGPTAPQTPITPARTAVVAATTTPATAIPPAAEVLRVGGPYDAQAAVLQLAARGYARIIGVGPEARAAVEQARAGGVLRP